MKLLRCLLITAALSATVPAYAQDDSGDVPNAARIDVRISQLEEQIRRMEGAIELLSNENKQLKGQMDKSNADTQYRLQALEKNAAPAAPANNTTVITPPGQQPDSNTLQSVQPEDNGDGTAVEPPSQPVAATPEFATPRDHYNYAFRLMNQAKYADAGASFASFAHLYPHDPLIGNAFYWLGETYYVRRQYLQAADNFRQGYEAMPAGPKAADNLLKLAMSLDAMKKDKEACVVLKQVSTKFDNAGSSIRSRADQEMNRIGCN